jgi:hypothetical protein
MVKLVGSSGCNISLMARSSDSSRSLPSTRLQPLSCAVSYLPASLVTELNMSASEPGDVISVVAEPSLLAGNPRQDYISFRIIDYLSRIHNMQFCFYLNSMDTILTLLKATSLPLIRRLMAPSPLLTCYLPNPQQLLMANLSSPHENDVQKVCRSLGYPSRISNHYRASEAQVFRFQEYEHVRLFWLPFMQMDSNHRSSALSELQTRAFTGIWFNLSTTSYSPSQELECSPEERPGCPQFLRRRVSDNSSSDACYVFLEVG